MNVSLQSPLMLRAAQNSPFFLQLNIRHFIFGFCATLWSPPSSCAKLCQWNPIIPCESALRDDFSWKVTKDILEHVRYPDGSCVHYQIHQRVNASWVTSFAALHTNVTNYSWFSDLIRISKNNWSSISDICRCKLISRRWQYVILSFPLFTISHLFSYAPSLKSEMLERPLSITHACWSQQEQLSHLLIYELFSHPPISLFSLTWFVLTSSPTWPLSFVSISLEFPSLPDPPSMVQPMCSFIHFEATVNSGAMMKLDSMAPAKFVDSDKVLMNMSSSLFASSSQLLKLGSDPSMTGLKSHLVQNGLPLPCTLCPHCTFLQAILASKFTQDPCSHRAKPYLSVLLPCEIGCCEHALGDALEWCLWTLTLFLNMWFHHFITLYISLLLLLLWL